MRLPFDRHEPERQGGAGCARLSGVFVHKDGQSYHFLRFYADGEAYQVNVGSPHRREKVIADVCKWFGRNLRLPPQTVALPFTFDGTTVRFGWEGYLKRSRFAFEGALGEDGRLWGTLREQVSGSAYRRTYDPLGDGVLVAPAIVDLNRADAALLATLPEIGPALAARIVADREARGPFGRVDDLLRVSGLGPTKLSFFRHLCTV